MLAAFDRPLRERAEAYGVWVALFTVCEVPISTFIVDADGRIAEVFPKVSPKTHDDVVLKALGDIAAA